MSDELRRPRKITLRVSGTRVGEAARPVESTLGLRPTSRFGLRANASKLVIGPKPAVPVDDDEVAS